MLLEILLLLPRTVSERERAFHKAYVWEAYETYYNSVCGTGYCDKLALGDLQEHVYYSMRILRRTDHSFHTAIRQFHRRAQAMESVLQPEQVPNVLQLRY